MSSCIHHQYLTYMFAQLYKFVREKFIIITTAVVNIIIERTFKDIIVDYIVEHEFKFYIFKYLKIVLFRTNLDHLCSKIVY